MEEHSGEKRNLIATCIPLDRIRVPLDPTFLPSDCTFIPLDRTFLPFDPTSIPLGSYLPSIRSYFHSIGSHPCSTRLYLSSIQSYFHSIGSYLPFYRTSIILSLGIIGILVYSSVTFHIYLYFRGKAIHWIVTIVRP